MKAPRLLAAALLSAAAGCATVQAPLQEHLQSEAAPVRTCAQWFQSLDEAVDGAGVRDAQYARVPGFPYLRVDRLLASLRERARAREAAFQAFAERLRELDAQSRRFEIDNLPRERLASLPGLGADSPRAAALQRTQECSRLLREIDLAKPELRAAMLKAASVPDDYSSASRALGLYPLTRIVFFDGAKKWEEESLAAFRAEPGAPPGASMVRYAPPLWAPMPRAAAAALLGRAQLDALGMPALSDREFARVASAYAPSFEIAVAADYDRFGALRWRAGSTTPVVDAGNPVVYAHPAFTRYGDQILLQLVYTIWFAERPPLGAGDLLSGKLDGLVWRVTLAPDGEPLVYDSIHP
jgi:hypothetical protein